MDRKSICLRSEVTDSRDFDSHVSEPSLPTNQRPFGYIPIIILEITGSRLKSICPAKVKMSGTGLRLLPEKE